MPWLPVMPVRWSETRAKNLFRKENRPVCEEDDVVTCFRDGMVTLRKNRRTTGFTESTQWSGYQGVRKGDLVIHVMDAFAGSIGVSDSDGKSTPVYNVCTAKQDLNNQYYAYALREMARAGYIQSLYRGIRERSSDFRFEVFATQRLPLPPRAEQDQIVRYLDWKVSQINRLINAKKKQIRLLQEQKRTVINEAVTEDGEGWQKKPLKYWVKSNEIALGSNTDSDFTFDYLDISSIGQGYVKKEPMRFTFDEAPSRARRIVRYGDTIISTVRTYLRSVCFINRELESCIVSTGFSVLTPDSDSVLPELLSFILTSDRFIDDVIRNSIGVSYPAINDSKLMNIRVALPLALSDQQKLYDKIKSQFFVFDKTITNVQGQVTLLHDYRTRLISDVVTGKMDVRDVSVPDFEEVEEALAEDETDELGADSTEGNDDDEP